MKNTRVHFPSNVKTYSKLEKNAINDAKFEGSIIYPKKNAYFEMVLLKQEQKLKSKKRNRFKK